MSGPAFALPAALAFFRALRVYPSPVELIMLYQSTLPAEVFAVSTTLIAISYMYLTSHTAYHGTDELGCE